MKCPGNVEIIANVLLCQYSPIFLITVEKFIAVYLPHMVRNGQTMFFPEAFFKKFQS